MTVAITFYDLLGLPQDASAAEIRTAYRRKQRSVHPDVASPDLADLAMLVNRAYETLSDPARRAEYDAGLSGAPQPQPRPAPQPHPNQRPAPRAPTEAMSVHIDASRLVATGPVRPERTIPKDRSFVPAWVTGAASVVVAATGVYVSHRLEPASGVGSLLAALAVLYAVCGVYGWAGKAPRLFALLVTATVGILIASPVVAVLASGQGENKRMWGALFALGLGVLVLAPALFSARWCRVARSRRRGTADIVPADLAAAREVGTPGVGLVDALDKFGRANVAKGMLGEQLTADALAALLDIPGVRIFHGMRFPGSDVADVDHLVVCGKKVALVDSKLWAPADYAWNEVGQVVHSGGHRSLETVTHFPAAVAGYAGALRGLRVAGWILVHPADQGAPSSFDNTLAAGVRLGDAQQVLEEIYAWFTDEHTGLVDRRDLARIWDLKGPG